MKWIKKWQNWSIWLKQVWASILTSFQHFFLFFMNIFFVFVCKTIYFNKKMCFKIFTARNSKFFMKKYWKMPKIAFETPTGGQDLQILRWKLCRTSSNISNYMTILCHFEFGDMTQKSAKSAPPWFYSIFPLFLRERIFQKKQQYFIYF